MRTLAPGIEANIFPGENVMLSVVPIEPHAQDTVHSHPEEQWGVLLEGKCTRIQNREAIDCVAEVLNRVRPLTPVLIRRLSAGLKIPADVLVRDYRLRPAA